MTGPAASEALSSPGPGSDRRIEPARLGLALFIIAEIMFFAGLISAYVMFRFSPVQWPPLGQPRLPWEVTAVNTLVLLLSAVTFQMAFKSLKRSGIQSFQKLLTLTALLGFTFLSIQGMEWIKLLHFGLTAQGSIFGGFFYCLVGTHAIHVTGGLIALLWVLNRAWRGRYTSQGTLGVELCRMYWFFVVALWPVIFALVYF